MNAYEETDEGQESHESKFFHIALDQPASAVQVSNALQAAGINGLTTPATFEEDGVILTSRMAAFTWDSQAGAGDFNEPGDNDTPRLADLPPEQQDRFVSAVLRNMNYYRGEMDLCNTTDAISRIVQVGEKGAPHRRIT